MIVDLFTSSLGCRNLSLSVSAPPLITCAVSRHHLHSYCFVCRFLFARSLTETGRRAYWQESHRKPAQLQQAFQQAAHPIRGWLLRPLFQVSKRLYDRLRHLINVLCNLKILNAALRLRAPVHWREPSTSPMVSFLYGIPLWLILVAQR